MAPRRTSIAPFLDQAHQLSIELSKLVMDPSEVKVYLDNFGPVVSSKSLAKLFYRSSNGSFDVKTKTFGTDHTSMFNEKIQTHQLDEAARLVSTKVNPIAAVPQTADRIEIIKSYQFDNAKHPNWIVHVALVRSLTNPLEFSTKLSNAKMLLADTDLDAMIPAAFDFVVTTLVQLERESIDHSQLIEIINDLGVAEVSDDEYQHAIHSLAKDIFRDSVTIAQFKKQSGFKRLCANTVELSRPIYFKQVLPVIDQFYITDKMDGVRAMLIIDEIYRRSGHRRIFLGANITAVSDQIYDISSFKKPSNSKTIETDHTVLDVEMMTNKKQEHTFYCFDVISFASKRVSGLPFKDRLAKFDEVKTLMEKYELGSVKEFVKLSAKSFPKQIKEFYATKRSYHIDGLIFTPEGIHYKEASKLKKNKFDRIFNTEYSNTISFKWKPLDQLTIDFYLMPHPTKKGSYILCSGVDSSTFEKLQMGFFDGYKPPASPNAHKYFPIQFEPYDGTFNNVWTPSKEEELICSKDVDCKSLDGTVGEFRFADGNKYLTKPQLIRLRTDRSHDIARGEYYGNALRYAEMIWHSVQYPLTVNQICEASDVGYFADDDNDWYKPQRNFNSFVKTQLMETYLYPKTQGKARMMDIACGKGQDIARAVDVGFDEIIAMDKDADALYELLERKYNLRVKRKGATASIHIKKIDLEDPSADTIKSLKIEAGSVDAAMINFAIHYICHSAGPDKLNPLTEFAKLNAHYLKPGARMMITAFNGGDVFRAIASKDEWTLREGGRVKYSIKKEFNSEQLTDLNQKIGVLLPFSAGQFYSEFLVNYDYLQAEFETNGFKMIRSDSFGSLLRTYKKANARGYQAMSDADKEWISLYSYMVLEKL